MELFWIKIWCYFQLVSTCIGQPDGNSGLSYCFIYCSVKWKGNKDKGEYPLSPDLLCYVPGEQGAGKRGSVLLGLIRIAVYKIIPSLSFDFTLIGI